MTLKEEMLAIKWRHSIDLGPELGVTPGSEPNYQARDAYLHLPESFAGLDVLDIGARDGRFSFIAEQRGAQRVLAMDSYNVPDSGSDGPSPKGIEFARRVLNSKAVRLAYGNIAKFDYRDIDSFDVVLFLGVLYHLQNPFGALQNIASYLRPDGLLILETHVDLCTIDRPVIALYPGAEADDDPTNWCGPNPKGVEALLQMAGFVQIQFMGGINMQPLPTLEQIQYGRGCWHARRAV